MSKKITYLFYFDNNQQSINDIKRVKEECFMEKEITSLMEKACVEILKKVVETGSISDNELLLITTYTKATQKKATKNDLQKLLGLGKEVASVIEKIFPNT